MENLWIKLTSDYGSSHLVTVQDTNEMPAFLMTECEILLNGGFCKETVDTKWRCKECSKIALTNRSSP